VTPEVSVVVPTFERPDQVDRLLAGLDVQTLAPERFEVVLADDGSARPPEPGARAYRVEVVRQEDRGFRAAAARNLGAAAARGDVLAFLDQDVVPAADYLERVLDATGDPWALTVGRRRHADLTGWGPDRVRPWLRGEGPGPEQLPEPEWLSEGYARTRDLTEPDDRAYQLVISAVLTLHRSLFERLDGFATSFPGYGGEDWELAHRAYVAGADLRYLADAVGWHDGPDLAGRADDLVAAKNAETLALARLVPDPGVRGRNLVWTVPETVVEVRPAGASAATLVACAESLLASGDVRVWLGDAELPGALDDPRVRVGPVPPEVLARARFHVTCPPVLLRGGSLRTLGVAAPLDRDGVTVRQTRDENRRARGCPPARPGSWPPGVELVPLLEEPFLERHWTSLGEEGPPPCR
jgi:GT2 family glycosyltransferase